MGDRVKKPEGRKLYSLRKQIPGTSVRHHQIGPRIPPVPAARARQGAWRVEPRDHGMEHQADVHPQLRLILPDAVPGCEKNGRRATWPVDSLLGFIKISKASAQAGLTVMDRLEPKPRQSAS